MFDFFIFFSVYFWGKAWLPLASMNTRHYWQTADGREHQSGLGSHGIPNERSGLGPIPYDTQGGHAMDSDLGGFMRAEHFPTPAKSYYSGLRPMVLGLSPFQLIRPITFLGAGPFEDFIWQGINTHFFK
jgi:hypothetical protein